MTRIQHYAELDDTLSFFAYAHRRRRRRRHHHHHHHHHQYIKTTS